MVLTGIFGNIGSGKTQLLTLIALQNINSSEVYANYHIQHPKIKVITPKSFIDLALSTEKTKHYMVALDEVYAWLDSRCSASHVNRLLGIIALQSRKRNMDIYYTAQLSSSVDLRLRSITDYVFYCEKIIGGFLYTFRWQTWKKVYEKKFYLPLYQAKKIWRMFDTTEVVKPIGLGKLYKKLLEIEEET